MTEEFYYDVQLENQAENTLYSVKLVFMIFARFCAMFLLNYATNNSADLN